jgi:poly-gamma-glutamate capsule biosynthesis protein CapA/YwtB (metallophosphatase superfamily)
MGKSFSRFFCLAALMLFASPAQASHVSFPDSMTPPSFDADYLVTDDEPSLTVLTVTLAGDCTLGGTESSGKKAGSLANTVEKKGLAFPFSGLLALFSQDDLTLVNLEGVLSDSSQGENTDKEFAFRGPAEYAKMLPLGSVEAVNLSNNHLDDYGKAGRDATLLALDKQGVAYAGNEWLCVYRTDRGKIGLAGIRGSLTEDKKETIVRQLALLKEADCQIIIYSLHAGQEYALKHNGMQKDMAHFLIDAGADVVAGHHPHVAQGIEIYKNRLIFYSLGNCVFGGNQDPRESDALTVRITFSLEGGKLTSLQAALYPIRFTGNQNGNTFRPDILSGKQAEALLKEVQQDTAFPLPAYVENTGALLPIIPAD